MKDPAFDLPMHYVGVVDTKTYQESKKPCPHDEKKIKFNCIICACEYVDKVIAELEKRNQEKKNE